ncbi:MAG: HAMP domain-containing sensor histidine kinase, partial [Gillisia sp.]
AFIQYQYLRIGLNLAKVQFNQKMANAIGDIKEGLSDNNELTFLAGKAMTRDDSYFKLSIDSVQDAARFFMNDYLKEKLLQNGIKTEFSYSIYSKDSTDYLKSPHNFNDEEALKYPFQLRGYLPDVVEKKLILELKFKDINNYFLFQLNGLTIPSILFLIAIIVVVLWVLRSFYWQRNVITTTNEFINNLTHELKTPVFSIGIATKILEDKIPEKDKNVLQIIREQTDKLKIQIDKVLELATIEGKKKVFSKKELNFKPVLEKICHEFQQISSLEKIDFKCRIAEETFNIYAEPNHLENAISSILDNARKYSSENSAILLKAYKLKNKMVIEITDNGIGIAEKDKKAIFTKYYRVSSGDIHTVKGYGLGLNYVQQVIKHHKGEIDLKSEIKKGSTFTIKIPLLT